jgi:hypothetical protein
MPIYLEAPRYNPGGPDGQGWNRLSLCAHIGSGMPQCALRPRSLAALATTHRSTRLADWGHYGPCTQRERRGDCAGCPVFEARPVLGFHECVTEVPVRLKEHTSGAGLVRQTYTEPWLMNRVDDGWGEWGEPTTWAHLAQVTDFRPARPFRDEHGDGFWMIRNQPTPAGTESKDSPK